MKRGITVLSFIFVVMLISFSAAFWPFDEPREAPVDVGATVGNEAPEIIGMATPFGASPVIPISKGSGGTRDVGVSFIVRDLNGASDIDVGTAAGTYSGPGTLESGPVTLTGCVETACAPGVCGGGNSVNITCTGTMQYYHDSGLWGIDVQVSDGIDTAQCGVGGSVACIDFTYGSIKELVDPVPQASINFAVTLGTANIEATGDPITLANGGNEDFTVSVTGYDLIGDTVPGDIIETTRFSAGSDTGAGEECGDDLDSKALLGDGLVTPSITNVLVPYGDGTINPDSDTINFCLYQAVTGVSTQSYSPATDWEILAE